MFPQTNETCFGWFEFVTLIISWCEPYRAGLMRWLKPVSVPIKCLSGVFLVPVTVQSSTDESAIINLPGYTDTFIYRLYL